jgi:hypothetical protein
MRGGERDAERAGSESAAGVAVASLLPPAALSQKAARYFTPSYRPSRSASPACHWIVRQAGFADL